MALRCNDIALAIAVLRAVPVGHPSISFQRRAIVNRAFCLDRPASIPNANRPRNLVWIRGLFLLRYSSAT